MKRTFIEFMAGEKALINFHDTEPSKCIHPLTHRMNKKDDGILGIPASAKYSIDVGGLYSYLTKPKQLKEKAPGLS